MLRPLALLSCMTACALSDASALAPSPRERRPTPMRPTFREGPASGGGRVDLASWSRDYRFCMLHICSRIGDGEMHRAVRATCLAISVLCVTSALAQDATLLDKYKDWSAYA